MWARPRPNVVGGGDWLAVGPFRLWVDKKRIDGAVW